MSLADHTAIYPIILTTFLHLHFSASVFLKVRDTTMDNPSLNLWSGVIKGTLENKPILVNREHLAS